MNQVSQPNNEGAEGVEVLDVPFGLDHHEDRTAWILISPSCFAYMLIEGEQFVSAFDSEELAWLSAKASPALRGKGYEPGEVKVQDVLGILREVNERPASEIQKYGIYAGLFFLDDGSKVRL